MNKIDKEKACIGFRNGLCIALLALFLSNFVVEADTQKLKEFHQEVMLLDKKLIFYLRYVFSSIIFNIPFALLSGFRFKADYGLGLYLGGITALAFFYSLNIPFLAVSYLLGGIIIARHFTYWGHLYKNLIDKKLQR